MSRLLPALLLACGLASPVAAQEPRLEWDRAGKTEPVITLGLKPADHLFPVRLSRTIADLAWRPSFADWVREWQRDASLRLAARRQLALDSTTSVRRDSVSFLPPLPVKLTKAASDTTGPDDGILGGALGEYADIGMMIRGRGEMGGSWNRYTPCDPAFQGTCKPSLFPRLTPDVQFGVVVGGTISERVHVNVDYDRSREFDAANNINVYYQGFEDEILQRLEVGDVSIRLPASRYLTEGIPAGNFGFKATGQVGPIEFQTVWAQQRGDVTTREFRLGGTGSTQGLVQDETLALDDADYVKGQFFYVVDPNTLSNAPHIDPLTLRGSDAPDDTRPVASSLIAVYRDERPAANNQQQQAQLGYFLADALMPSGSTTHRGQFKRLQQDKDYFVHSSGLWIMLRAPLRADEALAIAYVTEQGDTVGTLNAENAPVGTTPTLRLIRGPAAIHQPNFPTWDYEMHNVYRVHSSGSVQTSSIQLTISLGQASAGTISATTIAGQVPYLRLFGLDEDAPSEQLDVTQVFQPQTLSGSSLPGGNAPITGTYVMLPTLRPFFEPGPVNSVRLSAADARNALGRDANEKIYNDLDPVERDAAARFRLNFKYRVTVDGLVSSFSLGAFGLREESERITIGGRTLTRNTDYTIDYDIGQVTLLDAQNLFAANPGAEIRATWEQRSQFQIAPTSVFGMNAQYKLGQRGALNFVGLYQSEKSIMTRPQLGTEPGAIFMGGSSAQLDLGGALLDRLLGKIPGLRVSGVSAARLTAEAAVSMPNPNTKKAAYVDDFESADATSISLLRRSWQLGSRPQDISGTQGYLPGALTPANAAQLVWQHDILQNGVPTGSVLPRHIDEDLKIVGNEAPEPVMWLTLGDPQKPMSGRRWRSITTVLSTTGLDMTRAEYLEFYVRTGAGAGKALIFDIGTVSEDAFYFDSLGAVNGNYPDNVPWGLGVLDAEARLDRREVWGTDKDERGLWHQSCTGSGIAAAPIGDISANCARKNGYLDTEDLDGNGILDDNEVYFRYTVPLDVLTPYLVRDTSQTGTLYQLYRIPLRAGTSIGGASQVSWRYVKHMRMTLTSNTAQTSPDQVVLARLRVIGSRWVKRDIDGVRKGLLSDEKGVSAAAATVQASPVSRLTNGADYSSPPFIEDRLQDPSAGLGAGHDDFNEKALSLKYSSLGSNDRAEIYFRYPQEPRSFMTYRRMHLWAVARSGSWGEGGNERLVVKVGTDPRNYYLFQTRLNQAVGDRGVTENDWRPEVIIDFQQWFDLRARAELALLKGEQANPNEPYVLFSEDSTYAIVLEDRSRAPNLAAIRELSFAVFNGGSGTASGELWLNDVRLGAAFQDPGLAGNVTFDFNGGDFISTNISYANRGALFRQLSQDASYVQAGDFALNTSAQLGLLLPAGWNVDMPLTVSHSRNNQAPTLLQASDLRADELTGLRETGNSTTTVGVAVRKRTPSANPIISTLIDPLSLRVGYSSGHNSAITLRDEARGFDGRIAYSRDVRPLSLDIVPEFLENALRALAPAALEKSGFFERIVGAQLRYTPLRVSFSTGYYGQERNTFQYTSILVADSDGLIKPIESPRKTLDADMSIGFQPFNSLTANISMRTQRDLLPSDRATQRELERAAIEAVRGGLGGVDLGWETNRSVTSMLNFAPTVAEWIKPRWTISSTYSTDRSPSYLELVPVEGDTTAILQRRFSADRTLQTQVEIVPTLMVRALLGDSSGFVQKLFKPLQAIRLNWNDALGSQFDRRALDPSWRYQFALGDLEMLRIIGVDSASAARETGRFEGTTALRLGSTSSVELSYGTTSFENFDRRGRTRFDEEKIWPNVRFNWNQVPIPSFVKGIVPQLQFSASYMKRDRNEVYGNTAVADRGSEETNIPFSVRAIIAGGVTAAYSGTWTGGQSDDPTGDAEKDGMNHNLNVTIAVKPPESMSQKLKQPIRATLGLTQSSQQQCRFRTLTTGDVAESQCVTFIDFLNRTLNLTFDTMVQDMNVGLQLGYTSRQDMIGLKRGNSQFQLGVFANFELPVGRLPVGGAIR